MQDARADQGHGVNVDLIAVLVAVTDSQPCVLTIEQANALPSGPFELGHRSLQSGLRAWVEQQTGHPLGYIEQLYTFADRDRIGDEQPARDLDQLSRSDPRRHAGARPGAAGKLVRLFPVGGPPLRRAADSAG